MARLARWCFTHRRRLVALWILALVAGAGVSEVAGSSFNTNLSLPNTDSQAAVAGGVDAVAGDARGTRGSRGRSG